MPKYSVIVPVFNRPDEIQELLDSLSKQTVKDFEVVMVDGSHTNSNEAIANRFAQSANCKYHFVKGLGASESRNMGCEKAQGQYFVFFDSDCIIPEYYFSVLDKALDEHNYDAFGGPDAARDDFSPVMKAINFAMTSTFTTGGIRGKKKHSGKFLMRGFNMGVSRKAFDAVGGFSGMQVAEDIELSVRLQKAGYQTGLIPEAFVYHKRKVNFKRFFKQLKMHGKGRIDLYLKHPETLKPLHFFPSAFTVYLIGLIAGLIAVPNAIWLAAPLGLYAVILLVDGLMHYKSLPLAVLSIWASFLMLVAYGTGLMQNLVNRIVLRRGADTEKSVVLKN